MKYNDHPLSEKLYRGVPVSSTPPSSTNNAVKLMLAKYDAMKLKQSAPPWYRRIIYYTAALLTTSRKRNVS